MHGQPWHLQLIELKRHPKLLLLMSRLPQLSEKFQNGAALVRGVGFATQKILTRK